METSLHRLDYSQEQRQAIFAPLDARIFLEGPVGSGKTSAAVGRVLHLVENGIAGNQILVLTPQRSLGRPYMDLTALSRYPDGSLVETLTIGGLARRLVELFWPVVSGCFDFKYPKSPPTFLTLETAQYYMAQLVQPKLDQGYFESLVIDPNRLFSQILDDLNKAAAVGFPITEIGERLSSAWLGDPAQKKAYAQAQECATLFRSYCLQHNLLDFSIQLELFRTCIWPDAQCRRYITGRYHHLIFDNIEEDVPAAHDLVCEWLPLLDSALLVYDQDAGYRLFLGADPDGAYRLKDACPLRLEFSQSFQNTPALQSMVYLAAAACDRPSPLPETLPFLPETPVKACLETIHQRYYPEMLDKVAEATARLIHEEGVSPGEIAILSPFLSDGLRFSLAYRLEKLNVPLRTLRPSRGLREEPAIRCMLTLALAAHPDWQPRPDRDDLVPCLMQAIQGLDLIRASLLVGSAARSEQGLAPFSDLSPVVRERITNRVGLLYESLRNWLEEYRSGDPQELDIFFSRLFGEVLSQPGFGFHGDFDAGSAASRLIGSMQQFRWASGRGYDLASLGGEYIATVRKGIIAAQYFNSRSADDQAAVLLAPAFSFIMENRAVSYQFWLDCGNLGWWERLNQPLTHPYVLSRNWPQGKTWTDADEYKANQETLYRLVSGLIRRCNRQISVCISELNEGGFEQQGPLLQLIQRILKQSTFAAAAENLVE